MKKLLTLFLLALAVVSGGAQTLNVQTGQVTYQVPAAQAGEMVYTDGATLTIMNKAYAISDITRMYVDDGAVTDNAVDVVFSGATAAVSVAGNVAQYLTVGVSGADVVISQSADLPAEVTYTLSGSSTNGSLTLDGKLKATVVLDGLTLTSQTGAPLTINNGKRISIVVADGTTNTLTDAATGSQKACLFVKGHAEFTGGGTLTLTGRAKHAYRSNEYTELKKKFTGQFSIASAASDGLHVGQYFQQNGGTLTLAAIAGDGIQVDRTTDDDGNVEADAENTGEITIKGGTLTIATTGDGSKGLKAEGNVSLQGGTVSITQTGNLVVEADDLTYVTAVKSDADISVTGGTLTINNSAAGGKGLSADGSVSIDESTAATTIDITANGDGGTAETSGGTSDEAQKSYKVYVSLPSSGYGGPGGGNAWKTLYLYASDGTLVQQLTASTTRSSGYSTLTFYYYDFKAAGDGSTQYYFASDNYTSQGGGWGGSRTTYAIRSESFIAPTDGQDIYYSITSSYTTSGTTRTYRISDVTTSYGGTSDQSEESGTAYAAAGIKADAGVAIAAGTVSVKNSGAMSKSIKSKTSVAISGGDVTLTPSGAVRVISNDASYSSGIKAADFSLTGGTLTINASGAAGKGISVTSLTTEGGTLTINATGAGQTISNNRYTAKGIKADGNVALTGGDITITTTQAGAKGIKVNGTYTQGKADGTGPTLIVSTSGARYGSSSSSGGGWGGMGGKTTGQGGAAKAVKVMGTLTIYGGETTIKTSADGGEGLESRSSVDIRGGHHYLATYDDAISCSGPISFNGGVTVAYSNGNDAVDSNYGRTGAITIGNGTVLAYSTKGGAEEGLDCDNNSYIQITGTGIAVSAGGSQGGGGWGGSSSTISNAKQGYAFVTSSISYAANRYYTLSDASGNNLVTYSFPAGVSSSLSLFTATGMVKGSSYSVKYSTTAPTDAATAFHGLYLGSSAKGTTSVTSFTAQ